MDDAALIDLTRTTSLAPDLEGAIERARGALLARQKADGHWVFELEADATIPAEYVLLAHYLRETPDLELERKIAVYLRRIQGEHGGWSLFHGGAFDVSASVKAYFALKMIGDDPDAPHMALAREALLMRGGAAACNVFTRYLLAIFGQIGWRAVPQTPVEILHLPRWFPVHISKISYWARAVIVPLLVLRTLKVRARNPRGVDISELFVEDPRSVRELPKGAHQKPLWSFLFRQIDRALTLFEPFWPKTNRARAIAKAEAFVTERLNGEDGLGAIFPAMANSVMMYDALGVPPEDPRRAIARRSIDKLLIVKADEAYCQPCLSPVWDTALAAHALIETGDPKAEAAAAHALKWLQPLQVLDVKGDWAVERPDVRPGGWAFQYRNDHYPDLDDTAVVAMAMDRMEGRTDVYGEAIDRAREWVEGLQSRNGGWGAFDADNTYDYLNNIPFADHGALLDPPTSDVAARCLSFLAQIGEPADSPRMRAGLDFLRREQMPDGSWFGRWGVNYVYGTWSVLCALNAVGASPDDPMMSRGADWLIAIQNADGGWGEGCDSYRLDYSGYEPAPSAASQTAWAVLGLMAAGRTDHPAAARAIEWLLARETAGEWDEPGYTGGGFPRVFYLRYHGYAKFFPLWALARYRNLTRSNERRVAWGM